jgi:hypothetical protein
MTVTVKATQGALQPPEPGDNTMTFSHPSGSIATIIPLSAHVNRVDVRTDFVTGSSTLEEFETELEAILDTQDRGYVAD